MKDARDDVRNREWACVHVWVSAWKESGVGGGWGSVDERNFKKNPVTTESPQDELHTQNSFIPLPVTSYQITIKKLAQNSGYNTVDSRHNQVKQSLTTSIPQYLHFLYLKLTKVFLDFFTSSVQNQNTSNNNYNGYMCSCVIACACGNDNVWVNGQLNVNVFACNWISEWSVD